jgi:hypothetical protein
LARSAVAKGALLAAPGAAKDAERMAHLLPARAPVTVLKAQPSLSRPAPHALPWEPYTTLHTVDLLLDR